MGAVGVKHQTIPFFQWFFSTRPAPPQGRRSSNPELKSPKTCRPFAQHCPRDVPYFPGQDHRPRLMSVSRSTQQNLPRNKPVWAFRPRAIPLQSRSRLPSSEFSQAETSKKKLKADHRPTPMPSTNIGLTKSPRLYHLGAEVVPTSQWPREGPPFGAFRMTPLFSHKPAQREQTTGPEQNLFSAGFRPLPVVLISPKKVPQPLDTSNGFPVEFPSIFTGYFNIPVDVVRNGALYLLARGGTRSFFATKGSEFLLPKKRGNEKNLAALTLSLFPRRWNSFFADTPKDANSSKAAKTLRKKAEAQSWPPSRLISLRRIARNRSRNSRKSLQAQNKNRFSKFEELKLAPARSADHGTRAMLRAAAELQGIGSRRERPLRAVGQHGGKRRTAFLERWSSD